MEKEGHMHLTKRFCFVDDAGGESATLFPESGLSIGRFPDGEDTDDNSVDFPE